MSLQLEGLVGAEIENQRQGLEKMHRDGILGMALEIWIFVFHFNTSHKIHTTEEILNN